MLIYINLYLVKDILRSLINLYQVNATRTIIITTFSRLETAREIVGYEARVKKTTAADVFFEEDARKNCHTRFRNRF